MANLLKDTIKLANETKLHIDDICKKSKVGRRWYMKLKKGQWKDPGVTKVERVYKVLSESRA